MNYLSVLSALWKTKNVVQTEIKEAQMPTVSGKPGWKTTEFWFNIAAQVGLLWGTYSHLIPPQYSVPISIAGVAIYTIARTVAKAVADTQAAKATSSTVTTTAPVTTVTTPVS